MANEKNKNSAQNGQPKSIGLLRRWFPKIEMKENSTTEFSIVENGVVLKKIASWVHKQIETETDEWFDFLNWIIGSASFLLAQAIQGTPNPPLNAVIAIIWISILFLGKRKAIFPKHLFSGWSLSDDEKIIIQALNGKYLSVRRIFLEAPFFLIGYIYLFFMLFLALPQVQSISVSGHTFASIFLPETCVCIYKPLASEKPSTANKPSEEKKNEGGGANND